MVEIWLILIYQNLTSLKSVSNFQVCKLLRHVAVSETLQVTAKFTEINLRVYGPQVITAAKSLASYPESKIAQENLEVFEDMYQWLVSDVTTIVKDVIDASQLRTEKQVYMSLPRPGVSISVVWAMTQLDKLLHLTVAYLIKSHRYFSFSVCNK